MFIMSDSPLISMRFTGDEKIDSIFNNNKIMTCQTQKAYNGTKKQFEYAENLFKQDKNFKIYNMYYEELDNCLNCKYLLKNAEKYPNQLFEKKIEKPYNLSNSRGWIIKYGNYYYMLSVSNIVTMEMAIKCDNLHRQQERYILWKKMELGDLASYDRGSYWNLIVDNNIEI
jgi:hypothetical protein